MVSFFLFALDFGQSDKSFYGVFAFFKHNFFLALWWKINWLRWIYFFCVTPLKSLNLVLIPDAKLDGYRGSLTGCFYIISHFHGLLSLTVSLQIQVSTTSKRHMCFVHGHHEITSSIKINFKSLTVSLFHYTNK